MAQVCQRPAHEGDLPPTYGFHLDVEPGCKPVIVVYCARCVAFGITQDFFSRDEVISLYKL